MARYRQQWKRNNKIKSVQTSSTGLVINTNTHVDTSFQSMLDQSVTVVKQRRPTLSDSVRQRTRPSSVPLTFRKWKFHTLSFVAQDIIEPITSWTFSDGAGGFRKWTGYGNMTQCHMVATGRGLPSWPSVPGSSLFHAEMLAKMKALSHLDKPKLTLGEPIGELRTLPRDLNPVLNGLERVTRRYSQEVQRLGRVLKRSSKFQLLETASHVAAETWARYAFFAGPLIRTAEDICVEYASRMEVHDLWQTARGIEKLRTPSVYKTTNGSGASWAFTWEQVRWIEYEVHAGILFSSADRTTSVPGRLGLVKRDWPVTAWELFPLSFMIDRVVNVKRFLRTSIALTSPNVAISRDSFLTVRRLDVKMARIAKISAPTIPQANYTPVTSPWYRVEDFTLDRSRWWPDLGDVASTARGSGLFNDLRKMADVASLVRLHLN